MLPELQSRNQEASATGVGLPAILCLLVRPLEERPRSQLTQLGWDVDENTPGLYRVLGTDAAGCVPFVSTSLWLCLPSMRPSD